MIKKKIYKQPEQYYDNRKYEYIPVLGSLPIQWEDDYVNSEISRVLKNKYLEQSKTYGYNNSSIPLFNKLTGYDVNVFLTWQFYVIFIIVFIIYFTIAKIIIYAGGKKSFKK